jgi:hypothetical protein
MARPASINKPIEKKLSLDAELVARVELALFSDLEGRVPYGAWSGLIEQLLREHFNRAERQRALSEALQVAAISGDTEVAHSAADAMLVSELETLGYDLSAFKAMSKWYA